MTYNASRYGWTDSTGIRHHPMPEIQRANREAGLYFFEPGTLRFFGSRILAPSYSGKGGTFFVTSEKRPRSTDARRYSVRQFLPESGNVETVGTFQQFKTTRAAHDAARRYAAEGIPEAVKALPAVAL